jgi:hypothetical protein
MNALRILIIIVALFEAGWMTFDGARALTYGDYVTPKSGPYAGQLGPWHRIVSAVGIAPRSTFMKAAFVVYGVTWLVIIVAFARGASWSWAAMMGAAIGALWYLPIGTVFSLAQVVGLAWLRRTAWRIDRT